MNPNAKQMQSKKWVLNKKCFNTGWKSFSESNDNNI